MPFRWVQKARPPHSWYRIFARRKQGLDYDTPPSNGSRVRRNPLSVIISGPKDPPHSLGDMIIDGIYVWNSRKLVPKNDEPGAWSRKSHINVACVGTDPMVSAAAVTNKVHPAQSKLLSHLASAKGVPTPPNRWNSPTLCPLRKPTKWSL